MNRLPVPDVLIVAILELLKSNNDKVYTTRQITQYFWDNYSYPQSKTWKQLNAEVNAQIAIHKNKNGKYTQAYPLQVTEYQTIPYTYQYKDVSENTVLGKLNPQPKKDVVNKTTKVEKQMSFEDLMDQVDAILSPSHTVDTLIQAPVEKTADESILVEDVKACEKVVEMHDHKSSLIHWIITSNDKQKTMVEILKTIAEHV